MLSRILWGKMRHVIPWRKCSSGKKACMTFIWNSKDYFWYNTKMRNTGSFEVNTLVHVRKAQMKESKHGKSEYNPDVFWISQSNKILVIMTLMADLKLNLEEIKLHLSGLNTPNKSQIVKLDKKQDLVTRYLEETCIK